MRVINAVWALCLYWQIDDYYYYHSISQFGRQNCHVAAPVVWNSLPARLHSASISRGQLFRDGLKTHLFLQAYTRSSENCSFNCVFTYPLTYLPCGYCWCFRCLTCSDLVISSATHSGTYTDDTEHCTQHWHVSSFSDLLLLEATSRITMPDRTTVRPFVLDCSSKRKCSRKIYFGECCALVAYNSL